MDTATLSVLAQFGFAGLMAVLIGKAYQDLVPRMLNVIEENTAANTKMAGVIEANTRTTETLLRVVSDLDNRLERMEGDRRIRHLPGRQRQEAGRV